MTVRRVPSAGYADFSTLNIKHNNTMMILKQVEFGKKNKGGGKIKSNLASNKSRQRFAKEAADKQAAKEAEAKAAKTIKGRVIKAGKAIIDTAKANKKATAAVAIGTGTALAGVTAKKVIDKKKQAKVKAFSEETSRLKLFSDDDKKGFGQKVAEDASTAASLGAAAGLGYTGYQAAKGLKATAAQTGNKVLSKANLQAAKVNAQSKAAADRVAKLAGSQNAKIANKANAIQAFRKAGTGTKIAASAAAASILAGGASKLLGKKKNNAEA